jgi:hypothetical protein
MVPLNNLPPVAGLETLPYPTLDTTLLLLISVIQCSCLIKNISSSKFLQFVTFRHFYDTNIYEFPVDIDWH